LKNLASTWFKQEDLAFSPDNAIFVGRKLAASPVSTKASDACRESRECLTGNRCEPSNIVTVVEAIRAIEENTRRATF